MAARDEIIQLMSEHGLGYLSNPGGGKFTCIDERFPLHGFNCQVSAMNDDEDLIVLRNAIDVAVKLRG